VGKEALERLWRLVTPFEAAEGRGTHRGKRSTMEVVGQRRTPERDRSRGRRRGRWGW
jgi:hypothetical protein